MIGTELLTLGGSSAVGYVFKMFSTVLQDRHEQMMGMMGAQEKSKKEASTRGGVWVRRFIVLCLMGILVSISLGIGNQPTNIVTIEPSWEVLWGLFEGGTETVVTQVTGGMYDGTTRTSILAIIGYYFGQSSASR